MLLRNGPMLLLALVTLAACGGEENKPSGPCPGAAVLMGARPPDGFEEWCELDGEKHGRYRSWYSENDAPREEFFYNQGERCGVWRSWTAGGGLASSHEYAPCPY